MSVLTSKDNPKVKHWTKLAADARYRKAEKHALIEGPHLLAALQASGAQAVAILVTEKALANKEIAGLAGKSPLIVSEGVFGSIVEADNAPGIAAEIAIPAPKAKAGSDVVFLEGVQDPRNVGAIMRSAAAFGIGEVVLDQACADPWSPRALRAGMGGHFALAIRQVGRLEVSGFDGTLLCTVVRGGSTLRDAKLQGRLGWIFGGEGRGVSAEIEKLVRTKVTIPIAPGTESLNVAAAVAICLYEAGSAGRISRPAAGS
jgi:TrmH family RNA methyltransferase